MIDDGIDSDSCFTSLAVANDQLTLTPSNRNHRINCLNTCLKWFFYWLTENYTWCLTLNRHFIQISSNRTFTINRFTQSIDYTSNQTHTGFDRRDHSSSFYFRTFFDASTFTHQYHTHVIFFQVQGNGFYTIFKFNKLTGLYIVQSVYTSNTVTYLKNGAHFFQLSRGVEIGQLLTEYR